MAFENLDKILIIKENEPEKQICDRCGKEHSNKIIHKINNVPQKGICYACVKKMRYEIYISKPRNLEKKKQRDKMYLENPEKSTRHKETMKNHYKLNRDRYTYISSKTRGLDSDNFINKSFHGSVTTLIKKQWCIFPIGFIKRFIIIIIKVKA